MISGLSGSCFSWGWSCCFQIFLLWKQFFSPLKISLLFQNQIEKTLHKNWENKHVSLVKQSELQTVRSLIALQGSKNHGEIPVNGTDIAWGKMRFVYPCLISVIFSLYLFLILFLAAHFFFHFKVTNFNQTMIFQSHRTAFGGLSWPSIPSEIGHTKCLPCNFYSVWFWNFLGRRSMEREQGIMEQHPSQRFILLVVAVFWRYLWVLYLGSCGCVWRMRKANSGVSMFVVSSASRFVQDRESTGWCVAQLSFINLSPFSALLLKKETRRKLFMKGVDLTRESLKDGVEDGF